MRMITGNVSRFGAGGITTLLLLLLLSTGNLQSQTMMPLPNYGNTFSSSLIRGYWFQAPTDFRIVGVRVPTDVGTAPQNIQVVKLAAAPPSYPTTTTTHTTLGLWTNVNSTSMIPCDILVQTGDYIGIIGSRGTNGSTQSNSYATPSGAYTSYIFGLATTLRRFGHQGAQYPFGPVWTEPNGTISRVEMYYTSAVTGPNDAGISSIDSPMNFCAGNEDVIVTLKNYGSNQVTSATINWSVNGVPQTPYSWTGLLDTTSFAARQTQVTLANMSFQSGVPYNIIAYTSMPNGVQDTITSNDSSAVTVQAAIAGTFTIGGASPDYTDFTSAVTDLVNNGVCGPVVFNVRPGTYNEQLDLSAVNGASAVNTITFQSETGVNTDVNLTYSSTSFQNNYTISMGNAEWFTFKDMTVTGAGNSYGRAVYFGGAATDNTFQNCELVSQDVNSTSTYMAVVYSDYGTLDHRNSFIDCGFREGAYGLYMYGGGTTNTENDILVQGCEFTGQYYSPVRTYYLGSMDFVDNRVYLTNPAYTYRYPAQFYYGQDNNFERNIFFSDGGAYGYGIYLYYQNYYQSGSTRFVNNMVSVLNNTTRTYRGIYMYRSYNTLFAHNTVHINSSYSSGAAVYSYYTTGSDFYNNIFYNSGAGYAWYVNSGSYVNDTDYNLFYTTGNNIAYWSGSRSTLGVLQAASGMDANSISKTVTYKDPFTGDLHLTSPSEDDTDLFGTLLTSVGVDIDGETRVNPYMGADEACYVTPGSLNYSFVDGSGLPAAYAEAPGSIGVQYSVTFPEYASTVTFTVQFFDVQSNTLAYQTSFTASKSFGVPLSGIEYITLPSSLQPGAYKIEVIFNTKNSCDVYRDYMPYPMALLVVGEGQVPCVVWPGDVNVDHIVNYTDRRDLNMYIFNANLRTTWLNGPARYQADAETNPFTYIEWKPQAAAPWATPEGCYMDTDGNGTVNNMDYIAMKLNWSQTTPSYVGAPKSGASAAAASFTMDQNYPNPFNPATTIRYAVPEQAHVRLVVTDALGRQVAELVSGTVDQGVHDVQFDGANLSSGTYIATVTMTGTESGMTFTKTIKMALSK